MADAVTGASGERTAEPPVSVRLREETLEAHERVESTASFNRLIVVRLPNADAHSPQDERHRIERARAEYREMYRRFLVAAYGFEAAVDAALSGSPALPLAESRGYPREPSQPTRLIRDDMLSVFGEASVGQLTTMEGLPPIRTLAEFVGTEYVRRGSRAGGAVIGAVVQHNLGLTRESGGSFLMQYGKATRSIIVAFKSWADGLGMHEDDARHAVSAAIRTFDAIQRWHARLEQTFG